MKLVRQTTSSSDQFQKDSAPFGVRSSELLRGRKHHFIIENATAAELEAMDDLLCETEFADYCDTCPCYEDGYSCGWWVDIDDTAAFKEAYKSLKGEVAARIEANKAEAVDEALNNMTTDQIGILDRVVYNVRHSLLTEGSTIKSLRNDEYRNPVANPFHNARNPLTAEMWELVEQCLIIGKNETCASLRILEGKTGAEISRRRKAAEQAPAAPKVIIANGEAHQLQLTFNLSCEVTQRRTVESAYDLARIYDRMIGNADLLPQMWTKYGLSPADIDFIIAASQRLHSDVWAGDIEAAHAAALIEDDRFDGIIRDGLTPEQRAIQTRREGMDIYGEKFAQQYAQDYDEAWAYELKRNQAIRDEEVHLTTQIEFNKRQYIWEEVYNDEYKAIRLDIAHARALEQDEKRSLLIRCGVTGLNYATAHESEYPTLWDALAAWELLHTEALEINRVMDENGITAPEAMLTIARRGVEHMMTFTPEEEALWHAETPRSQGITLRPDPVDDELDDDEEDDDEPDEEDQPRYQLSAEERRRYGIPDAEMVEVSSEENYRPCTKIS